MQSRGSERLNGADEGDEEARRHGAAPASGVQLGEEVARGRGGDGAVRRDKGGSGARWRLDEASGGAAPGMGACGGGRGVGPQGAGERPDQVGEEMGIEQKSGGVSALGLLEWEG